MDYVSIRVTTLRGDQKIGFDAYLKLNDKMVLYLKRGDSFEGERLSRLKAKKLKRMFILSSDEGNYRDYMHRNIEIAYDNKSNKDIATRSEIIQGNQQNNAEEVFENPDSIEKYNDTKDAAGKYVDFLISNSEATKAILKIENADQSLAHHGVTVSTLSVALAQKLKMVDPKQTQLLALGALLHDFGHHGAEVPPGKIGEYDKQKLAKYKEHPTVGAKNVQDKKHFDQVVTNIIMQHEECIDGSGYPQRFTEKQTDPLAVIVSSANAIDRLVAFEGVSKADAAKHLMINSVGKHPLQHIQILSEILKNS